LRLVFVLVTAGFAIATLSPKSKRPDRPADERGRGTTCWFGAGRTAVIPRPVPQHPRAALSGGSRSPRGRPSRHCACPALSLCRTLCQAGVTLLLPVTGMSVEFTSRVSIPRMCFDEDSHPPIPPIAGAAVDGKRITLHSADGTDFAAFAAQPAQ